MSDGSGVPAAASLSDVATEHAAALLRSIVQRMSDGLVIVGSDRRVRSVSDRAREILGADGSWPGRLLSQVGADYRLVLTVASCFDHGTPIGRSLSEVRGAREISVWALPLGPGAGDQEVAVLVRDESEVRRLDAVRRDFIANVSHELRTPATAIKLMVETLQEGALQDGEAAGGFVDRIGQESDHMARMIEELLELSAAESERRIANPVPVAIADLLASLARLRPLAEDRGVRIVIDCAEGLPPVLGDAPRLGQVVRNLVHNAIKFSPRGGDVTVAVRRVSDGGCVELRVIDQGAGIPAEDLPRIFERFWKGDASRQRVGEGSGLGLAIARHIIDAHGGSITARSAPGQGSVFSVILPAPPAAT